MDYDKFGPDDFPDWIDDSDWPEEMKAAHSRLRGYEILPTSRVIWIGHVINGMFTLTVFNCFETALGGALDYSGHEDFVLIADVLRGATELREAVVVGEGGRDTIPTKLMVGSAMKKFETVNYETLQGA